MSKDPDIRKAQLSLTVAVLSLLAASMTLAFVAGYSNGSVRGLLIAGAFTVIPFGMYPIALFGRRTEGRTLNYSVFPRAMCWVLNRLRLPIM